MSDSLFRCPQKKWPFWRAGFYPANQSNLKAFNWGMKKASSPKKPLCF